MAIGIKCIAVNRESFLSSAKERGARKNILTATNFCGIKNSGGAFQNFDEAQAVNVIASTFNEKSFENVFANNCTFNFNPVDKWIEASEEIKRLNAELLKVKDEQIKMLEKLIEKR